MKREYYLQKIDRLYKGYASVRQTIIAECIRRGQDLVIEWNGNYMGVPLEHLKNPILYQIHTTRFESRYNKGQSYYLYDFKFIKNKGVIIKKKGDEEKV